ncbi:MAG: multifunctional oxoglutarate decarboxylase/oxoglutarate dehydrogenase thiamine pyrophosphate-binding subunit/dihydrolipoyllysine-residue succinyltransferase subunit [Planctomycetota bacterium]
MSPSSEPSHTLSGLGAAYIDYLYNNYKTNPGGIEGAWSSYFSHLTPAERAALEAGIAEREAAAIADASGAPASEPRVSVKSPPLDAAHASKPAAEPEGLEPLKGVAGKIVENMEASREMPTATTFRNIPVKALEENRRLLNRYLESRGKSKLTFTQLIGYALVRALIKHPALNNSYELSGGKHYRRVPPAVNFGLAVDLPTAGGGRSLVVANVKNAAALGFVEFCAGIDDIIHRARAGKLGPSDFQGTTITLTNPGTLGTIASVPRLMKGQGAILATGAIEYSAEAQAMSDAMRAGLGLSKMMGITSTYDHRVIQGAESGAYLAYVHELLIGQHEFYENIFDALRAPFEPFVHQADTATPAVSINAIRNSMERAAHTANLIQAFRTHGHLYCSLDPLGAERRPKHRALQLDYYNFTIWDLDRDFFVGNFLPGNRDGFLTLRAALEQLRDIYCGTIGYEYEYLIDAGRRGWLREKVESAPADYGLDAAARLQILRRLIEADSFERFLHLRYVGQKRFSLEGGDALIPMLDLIFDRSIGAGLAEIVIGMAHRGRLNVLANLVGMPLEKILAEFEGMPAGASRGASGDVKYHLGYEGRYYSSTSQKNIPVTLACNPSHLEAVNPVVEGMARAKQDLLNDTERKRVLPVLIHGDAAFAGQGVVMETLQMSGIEGHQTGGTIHIIINNQIGYTANPRDARSSVYCSDLAKAIEAPIIHVNGDDAAACAHAAKLAFEYQQKFAADIVIDLVCYRRHGHNEGDEPGFTQPLLYQIIEKHPAPRAVFERQLVRAKITDAESAKSYEDEYVLKLTKARDAVKNRTWTPRVESVEVAPAAAPTAVSRERCVALGTAVSSWPATFTPHPKIERLFRRRRQMVETNDAPLDFGMAETLAYATLLSEGVPIRITGEDSGRGTFSHRHSVLHDYTNAERYIPLNYLSGPMQRMEGQGSLEMIDSLLSEEAALGYEYGYSVTRHGRRNSEDTNTESMLIIWEAQFGDFVNGAQIQIDQFIAAGEAKWGQSCGLVLYLPHGHDGQGPEHSSARLERFLQLCACDNLRVANVTTAAQFFHLLRDQVYRRPQKPLIVMTPKSLLRAEQAASPLDHFVNGAFEPVVDDTKLPHGGPAAESCRRVLLCSGKVYYDLESEREQLQQFGAAILRVERLYPFPADELRERLSAYSQAEICWVQEEPANMGAATFVVPRIATIANRPVSLVSRPENPSPAAGSSRAHLAELQQLLAAAFAGL